MKLGWKNNYKSRYAIDITGTDPLSLRGLFSKLFGMQNKKN